MQRTCGSPPCSSALAGEAHADDGTLDRLVEVGVRHDDHRALAAELEGHRDELLGGRLVDDPAGLDRAREGDLAHVLVRYERAAALGTVAGEQVEDPGRQDWFMICAGAQGGEWGLLGRLDHHGIAGNECRRDLERHQEERHVPRDDRPHHAERLAQREGQHLRIEGDRLALELGAEPAVENEDVGEHRGLDAALGPERLAGLECHEAAELLDMIVQEASALGEELAALACRAPGPGSSAPSAPTPPRQRRCPPRRRGPRRSPLRLPGSRPERCGPRSPGWRPR